MAHELVCGGFYEGVVRSRCFKQSISRGRGNTTTRVVTRQRKGGREGGLVRGS